MFTVQFFQRWCRFSIFQNQKESGQGGQGGIREHLWQLELLGHSRPQPDFSVATLVPQKPWLLEAAGKRAVSAAWFHLTQAPALTSPFLSIAQVRRDHDPPLLSHANTKQTFIYPRNHVALPDVRVKGAIPRVTGSEEKNEVLHRATHWPPDPGTGGTVGSEDTGGRRAPLKLRTRIHTRRGSGVSRSPPRSKPPHPPCGQVMNGTRRPEHARKCSSCKLDWTLRPRQVNEKMHQEALIRNEDNVSSTYRGE